MKALKEALLRVRVGMRAARQGCDAPAARELAQAFVHLGDEAESAGAELSAELLPLLASLPRLCESDRALVLARLQRTLASLEARVAPVEDRPVAKGPAGPQRLARTAAPDDPLSQPARSLKGIGEKMAAQLAERGLETVGDLVRLVPRGYEDRRRGGKAAELLAGQPGFVVGTVHKLRTMWTRRTRGLRLELRDDDDAPVILLWFAAFSLRFEVGERLRVSGIARAFSDGVGMVHADVERIVPGDDEGPAQNPIVPRYPEIDGIPRKRLWRFIGEALAALPAELTDPLPEPVRAAAGLPALAESLRAVHFPTPESDVLALVSFRAPAQRRLIFEELFALQLALARAQQGRATEPGIAFPAGSLRAGGSLVERALALLPYRLTGAQERAIAQIHDDMRAPQPMSRLLQGDVGSGKTVVALCAALRAIENGHQAAILAPTEVLAEQHHRVLGGLVSKLGVSTAYVTSALSGAKRCGRRCRRSSPSWSSGRRPCWRTACSSMRWGCASSTSSTASASCSALHSRRRRPRGSRPISW